MVKTLKDRKLAQAGFAALVLGNSAPGFHSLAMTVVWGVLAVLVAVCVAGLCYLMYILTRGRTWRPGDEVPDVRRPLPAPGRMRDRD